MKPAEPVIKNARHRPRTGQGMTGGGDGVIKARLWKDFTVRYQGERDEIQKVEGGREG